MATLSSVKKLKERLENELTDLICSREDVYDNRSEEWQDSDKGDEYNSVTEALQDLLNDMEGHDI